MLLLPNVGLPIRTRFSSSSETSEYGSDVDDDWFISRVMRPCTSAFSSFSPGFLPARLLPSSVSLIVSVLRGGAILAPRLLFLVLSRPLIMPGLALVICYEKEKFSIFDKLLNQDSENSALLSDMASSVMKRVEFVSIFFFHILIVEGIRLLVLWIPLDFQ